jgi:hypothetical protein
MTARIADFSEVQEKADRLVRDRRYGAAIAAYRAYRAALETAGKPPADTVDKIERQIGFVRAEAQQAFTRARDDAGEAVKAKRFAEAIERYQSVIDRFEIEEYVTAARHEIDLLRPLLASQKETGSKKTAAELQAVYRETAETVHKMVRDFALERAVAASEKLVGELEGSALEPSAKRHLAHLRRLLALKQRIIARVNAAPGKLRSDELGLRASASVLTLADAEGITLRASDKVEKRPWSKLSDWETYAIARKASNTDSPDDLTALGLLSLEQGNRRRAEADLRRAKRFGATVDDLLARAAGAGPEPAEPGGELEPEQMLVHARSLVAKKQWLDALALLIPLKEKHAKTNYAIRNKLDELNRMLAACVRGLEEADRARDVAAGVETPLLAGDLKGWKKRGTWRAVGGRVRCENKADHDVDLMHPVKPMPAYRLTVRCRVVEGNGLVVRVASVGEDHVDFWLSAADAKRCGLWASRGGKVKQKALKPIAVKPGEWVDVVAVVTRDYVRVACRDVAVRLPNKLPAKGEDRSLGLLTRQGSTAEFEGMRLRVLFEQ